MTRKLPASLLAIACVLLASCSDLARRDELSATQWRQVAETLEHEATPDSLVTSALIREAQLRDPAAALVPLDRALALDPQQPDAAWLAISVCVEIAGCSTAPYSAKLDALDPRNATVHYADLTGARARGDVAAEDLALSGMAGASYFDIYWSRLITRGTDTLAKPRGRGQRPLRELPQAAVEVVGWLAGIDIPAYSSVNLTCKGERLQREDVTAWCRKVASALDSGDTYVTQMIGRAIAYRVWPSDSAEVARLRERSREFNYVREALTPFNDTVAGSVENTQRWINGFRSNRSEHDVNRQLLTELGIPPDPPADWVSKSEQKK